MHGYRRPRHLVPLPISPSTSLLAPSLSAPLQPRSLKPQSIRQRASHAAARGNARVALSSVLYISSRFIASTTTASSSHETATASSIRSTQDLHTALISLAQAATAASASPTFGAARKAPSSPLERTLFKETATATRDNMASGETPSMGVAQTSQDDTVKSGSSNFPLPLSRQSSSHAGTADTERRLLQRLLLHRRSSRHSQNKSFASATASPSPSVESRLPIHSRSSLSSFPHAIRPDASVHRDAGVVAKLSDGSQASSWARAFELFSEAVQQHHVSPTTQHFNLLLYIAQQHRLWTRVDAVEGFQAQLLASVQQLVEEKKKEVRRRQKEEDDRSGGKAVALGESAQHDASAGSSLTGVSLPASKAAVLSNQIAELREMEAALMPNAQTYELLLNAALARGSWSRALEYCEMRAQSGVAVLTDRAVRQVLQVYALAGEAPVSAGAPSASPTISSPLQRLRTDQQGPGLRAAAQPRSPSTSATTTTSPPPPPHWSVALAFFRSSLHCVTSMQTVWSMVTLLQRAGQSAEVLQVLNDDCRGLLQASLFSLAVHGMRHSHEQEALLQTLRAMSDAAREIGDWRVAQQLLQDVVELRRQQSYTQGSVADKRWGVSSSLPSSALTRDAAGPPLPSVMGNEHEVEGTLRDVDRNRNDDTWMEDEEQLSQYVLQSTLHTLRRVRRYPDMIALYRSSPHHHHHHARDAPGADVAGTNAMVVRGRETTVGELTLVWQTMWTAQAIGFIAQAGLATGDLDLLLELCGFVGAGNSLADYAEPLTIAATPRTTADPPADVYDAALRLLQSHILQHRLRHSAVLDTAATPVNSHDKAAAESHARRCVTLSQRVYAAYRRRALEAVHAASSPQHQYLARVLEGKATPSVVSRRRQRKQESLRETSPALTQTHAPLVQLLDQSLRSDASAAVFRSLQQQALAHFKRIRRPDTLAIALTMDIIRAPVRLSALATRSSRQGSTLLFTDADAQSVVRAVQDVYDSVLEEEGLGSVQLLHTSTSTSVAHTDSRQPFGSVSVQQLTALSVVTGVAVLLSCEVLACAQPLVLLRLLPLTAHLGWLPRELVPLQLEVAQRAAVEWAAARQCAVTAPIRQQPAPAASTATKTQPSAAHSVAQPSGAAVARFIQLYARSTTTDVSPEPLPPQQQQVLAAAAQLLAELQRTTVGRPPAAAMAAFKHALHDAWPFRKVPRRDDDDDDVETASIAAVVASINAVVQQVGASTVSRWTMWGDCADLLDGFLASPLASYVHRARETEKRTDAAARREDDSAEEASRRLRQAMPQPNLDTLRVLHTFLRLCDKAEAPFVEYVTIHWLLGNASETAAAEASRPRSKSQAGGQLACSVEKLCEMCEMCSPGASAASRSTTTRPSVLSDLHMETMLLLLDALSWACRRHHRPLARQLHGTLAPWIDKLLSFDGASHQLARLHDAAQSSCMTLLQCFSNGARSDVLRDWSVQLHVLRQLTLSAAQQQQQFRTSSLSTSLNRLRRTAVLVDGLATVVVKLHRTFRFLLTEIALDAHRARTAAAAAAAAAAGGAAAKNTSMEVRNSSPKDKEAQRWHVVPQHCSAVEKAADEFSTCTTDLLLRLVCPCLEVSAEAEMAQQSDALSQQQLARVVAASLVASAHKITDAVWEVDYVAFVWHADFRNPTTTQQGKADADRETSARALIGLRQRGFQLLTSQLRWSDTASALSRPVRLWLLFTAHATLTTARTTKAAVAELCRDLTSLEMFYSLNRPSLRSLSNATAAAAVEQRLVPEPFLHFFIQQVDELTTAMLSRAVLASSAPAHAAGPASALPHMPDGSSPMDRFTKPLVHFSPAVLRPLQQAAQQALYLSLCEGTTDVQPACTARQVTDGRAGAAAAAFSSSAEPCLLPPALLRRCLAWPGQPSQYPILLHTVEVAAYETLREPATVVDVFQAMTQLHSAESTLARPRDSGSDNRNNDNDGQRTSAEMFLTFYLQSASLRRAAPVSEQVCLAALLACAAATAAAASSLDCAPGVRVYAAPPQDLVTLLSAFPQVLSIALFQQWQQHKLTRLQEAVLRSWTLVLLWGGTQASAPDGATEPYRTQSPAPFPLPLRRAALQWLVLTQGTVRPPLAASRHVSSASGGSSAQLVALLNTASESFAKLVTDSLPNDCALQAANERLVSVLSVVPHHSSSSTSSSMSNGEANVSAAVSYCCTRHAVQQLLLHYPAAGHCANSNRATPHVEETQRRNWEVPRTAVRPCAAEMEALVRVLPAPAQEEARERFINGAPDVFDPFASSATQSSTSSCCGREETGRRLDEWAVALLRWVDHFAAEDKRSCTKSAHSSVPPPPSLAIVSSEEAALTWEGLHTHVRAAACELLERPPTLSPVHTTRLKDGEKDFLVSAQLRLSSLRPFIEHFARQGTTLRTSGQTSAAAEVSALVNTLLLFCGVYVPLASSTSASPQEAIALLRRELLMLVCAIAPPSSAHGPFSKCSVELYEWFVQQHLRHLLSLNTPTQASPPLPVAAAAVEAFAIGTLLLHHISVAACTLCGCSTTSSAKAFDTVYKVAHELLQQSGQDLCVLCSVLHVGRGDATTLLVCCAVRVWMQASVLLGDAHAVLAAAQRMAADLLRRQRMKAAALWADKVASVESSSSSSSKSCLESDARAAAEWLSVVPVAASVVHAMALQSRAAKAAEDESLASLLTVLPFLRRDDDEDHAPASCDGYASLIQFWREQMQQSAAQRQEHSGFGSGSPSLTPALQHRGYLLRLMAVQPFSVVFQLPRLAPREAADARQRSGKTTKMAERLRRNVTDYLAGSPAAYPPLPPPRFRPCLASAQGAASIVFASEEASVETSLTTERLRAAMQRVREATSEEMTAFMQLESTKRGVRKGAQQQRGEAVRHAWHLIERVALQHRQRLSSNHVELDTPPLTPWHEWTSYFLCRNVVAVPHTIHFLRPAVSEVLMLESCRDWAEAMAVVQHSLSSLKRTGATPVQQYMVQLLLQRVRTTSDVLSPRDHDPQAPSASDFCARLGSFTYTPSPTDASAASGEEGEALRFSQGLWNQHVGGHAARGAAALTCRLIDILLGSYHGHRAPPASSSATSAFLAQHTLMEALRCSVHDLVVTRGLFLLFWAQRYQRVEGAHAFLSALRAAKIAGDEAFAVQAMLTYLWVTTSDSASQRTELWRTQVLPLLSGQKEIGSRAVDVVAIEKAVQATTHSTYQLSVEAHRAVWKSWAVLCRMGVISEAAALGIVNSFKALNRLSEVDELMVTTCYAIRK